MAKKEIKTESASVDSAVSDAFSGMSDLKDELESWLDGMPENLQNGSKADELREAIDTIDGVSEIDVPDAADSLECTFYRTKQKSRNDRCAYYCGMLSAASETVRQRISELEELEYDAENDNTLIVDGAAIDPATYEGHDPTTEDDRDSAVSELETFADEIENAQSEFESVYFPGMR